MEGKAALVTGGASGIGQDLCLELGRRGVAVTVADIDAAGAQRVAEQVQAAGGRAAAVHCDVSDAAQHEYAFSLHMQRFGRLDYALLNAGIGERGNFLKSEGSDWQATLDIDLRAVAEGVRFAAKAMRGANSGSSSNGGNGSRGSNGSDGSGELGVIMITASAGGLYPMPLSPIYAAAKAGAVQLTRSLAEPLMKRSIRICALCPQFTDTALVRGMQRENARVAAEVMRDTQGRLLSVHQVTQAGLSLLEDGSKVGTVLVVLAGGNWVEPLRTRFKSVAMPEAAASARVDPALRNWASSGIPAAAQVIEVHQLSTDFRKATHIVSRPLPSPLPPGHVLIKRLYAGINASDVNYSAGRYFGTTAAAQAKLPFPAGFEAVGVVAAAAPDSGLVVGQPVATMTYGGFADWAVVQAKHAFPVPTAAPEMVALMTSGLTASLALEQTGQMRSGETVLVTAAAGGTGQLAVQLAKLAGNHVVATCSTEDKAALLRSLGADRVINYKQESVKEVLRREYPKGINLIYESVGGEMFATCVDALAVQGRLVIIGMMSQYAEGWARSQHEGLAEKLLWKSASLRGFFLLHYAPLWRRHLRKLAGLLEEGRLRVELDAKRFVGLDAVPDAVEWLQTGRSMGKVFVQLAAQLPPSAGGSSSSSSGSVRARL